MTLCSDCPKLTHAGPKRARCCHEHAAWERAKKEAERRRLEKLSKKDRP